MHLLIYMHVLNRSRRQQRRLGFLLMLTFIAKLDCLGESAALEVFEDEVMGMTIIGRWISIEVDRQLRRITRTNLDES